MYAFLISSIRATCSIPPSSVCTLIPVFPSLQESRQLLSNATGGCSVSVCLTPLSSYHLSYSVFHCRPAANVTGISCHLKI